MPEASKNYGIIDLYSRYTAYTMNVAGKPEYRTSSASAAESSTFAASFSDLGIPAGSTINSAVFTYETLNHPLHGFATKALQKGTTVLDSWFDSGDAITFADINGSHIRFVTAKNNTNYPSMPSLSGYENSLVNESRWRIENVTLTVDYTLPYTNCTPPTTLTLNKNNVAPNENVTLSWSGASGGTNNPIAFYNVYQSTSASGAYTHILSTTSASTTSAPVSSPSANGSSYFYKIVAVGTVSGYDSGYSAASAGLKTVWTVPSVSNVKVAGSASAIYVEAGSSVSLSWAGTNGTNNPITSYTILRNGVAIKTGQAASPYSVTAHSTVNSSYYFSVQPIGTHENGSAVNSPTVYSYGLCSAPSSISVSKTSVGPNTGVTLSWSGASGGGSYNGISGYDIYRSTSPTSGFSKIDSITTTATSGSRTVTSSGTNGTTYYYRVVTVGARKNSAQSASSSGVKTEWTNASAPTSLSLSENNVSPGKNVTLSWSGQAGGTNNPIVSYNVYRSTSASGTYSLLGNATSASMTVASPADNGAEYFYKVISVGAVSGANSDYSAASAGLKTVWTAPTVSGVKLNGSTSYIYVVKGTNVTLSWASANGTNNAITSYTIYQNGSEYKTGVTGTSLSVPSHATVDSYYYYSVRAIAPLANSTQVAGPRVYSYDAVGAPTSVSVASNNVAPGASITLSWSGASGGGSYNAIKSYKVYRATSASGSYAYLGAVTTTATSGSMSVTSQSANGASYYYKVVTVGDRTESGQSTVYATLTTSFSAPSVSNMRLNNSSSNIYVLAGSAVSLSWSGSAGTNNPIQSYTIARNGTNIKTGQAASPYSVTAHETSGSSYYFSVQPIGTYSNGSAVNSPTVYSYNLCTAPTAVSAAATNVGPGAEVKISWSGAGSGGNYNTIAGYEVYRSTSASGNYTLLKSVDGTASSGETMVSSPTTNGASYFYKIVTKGSRGNSVQSTVYATIKTVWTAPSVSNVTMSTQYVAPSGSATLSWNASSGTNNAVISYTVFRDGVQFQTWLTSRTLSVQGHGTAGSSYVYSVQAVGALSNSATVDAPTLYSYGATTPPSTVSVTPTIVDAGTTATLSWSGAGAGALNNIVGYKIYRATSQNGDYTLVETVSGTETSGSRSVTAHATMGQTYWFKVATVGENGESALSTASAFLTSQTYSNVTAPSTVSVNPAIVDAGTTATLSWSGAGAGTNNPITKYSIYRSTSESSGYALLKEVSSTETSGQTTVTSHSTMGAKYYYKVETIGTKTGFNASGQSTATATLTSKVYTPVGAPTSVSVSSSLINPDSTVTISWSGATAGTNVSIAGYEVWRSINGSSYVLYKSVSAGTASQTDTVGASGTTQDYKVLTVANVSGYNSGFSSVATVTSNSPPQKPTSVTASPALYESGNVTISFPACIDVDGNLSHYQIQRRIQTVASGWGPWTNLNTSFTTTSITDSPSVERGMQVQYQVKAHDTLGLSSDYTQTIQVKRNQLPAKPTILFPATGATIYNTKPYIGIQVAAEPDGTTQALQMSIGSGAFASVQNVAASGATVVFRVGDVLAAGEHTMKFRTIDSLGAVSAETTTIITVASPGYSRTISSGSIIANASISHQNEIEQLFNQVNHVRQYYGLTAITVPAKVGNFVNVAPGNIGMFAAWGSQMNTLQNGISATWAKSGITPATWISCTSGMYPRADIIAQIRSEISRA